MSRPFFATLIGCWEKDEERPGDFYVGVEDKLKKGPRSVRVPVSSPFTLKRLIIPSEHAADLRVTAIYADEKKIFGEVDAFEFSEVSEPIVLNATAANAFRIDLRAA